MSRPLPKKLTVVNKQLITTHLIRITLAGDALTDYPQEQQSGYIKLHFAKADILNGDLLEQLLSEDASSRPLLRTYTIRNQRYNPNQIDIDFVLHESGPATTWAANCQLNDTMYISNPGKKKIVDLTADWFFIVGDMSALPAISVNLSLLPSTAKGYAVIQVMGESDIQALVVPKDFTLHWVINNSPHDKHELINQVKQFRPLTGTVSVWLACEFDALHELREYFYHTLNIAKRQVYASSYWKHGLCEQEHKKLKSSSN